MNGLDQTLRLMRHGYGFISRLRAGAGSDIVETRLLGQPVTCVSGQDAARLLYDEARFERGTAMPGFVKQTLVGQGGVQGLDGDPHRVRKALFMSLMSPDSVAALVDATALEWAAAARRWADATEVVLFDESAEILLRGACRWANAPIPRAGASATAENLTTMVDGFGTLGPRHWRARLARGRTELWATQVIKDVRGGVWPASPSSVAYRVATHHDAYGDLMPPHVAAVELLNVIRPIVAISWYVTFTAHALYQHPEWRSELRDASDSTSDSFAQEVRRFYPFTPFIGARARDDFTWRGHHFPRGRLVLLDVYGTDHDPQLWDDPDVFDPNRFIGREPTPFDLIPQGAGDPGTGHRCPGEPITVELIKQAALFLAHLDYGVPDQDLSIPLSRIPTRPTSGFIMSNMARSAHVGRP